MAIRAGQILHVANQFVVDRIQTGGPGNLTIPQDKIYELGNYRSVGIVRDVPDLTFSLECLEVDTEVEALLTGSSNPFTDAASTKYELALSKPLDIISPWKSPYGQFKIVHGVAVPYLYLESANYRYGLTDNAGETFSLRGDSIYYVPGTPWQDIKTGGTATAIPFLHGPALEYNEGGVVKFALCVTLNGHRLNRGSEYTDTAAAVTLAVAPVATDVIAIVYGSAVEPTSGQYTQTGQDPFGATDAHLTHQGTTVKPAAIRGKDIDVFFSTSVSGSPVEVRWPDVQSATLDWTQTLEEDREFGNPNAVSRDPTDVPVVNGTVEVKPRSVDFFFDRLRQVTGVQALDEIMGPQSSITGALRIEVRNPSGGTTAAAAGAVLKTHYVPVARFTMPGYSGTVQQKLSTTLNWESDDGVHEVYKGVRA